MSFHSATTCKAVILAAGKGTRLSSLTSEKPKCFVRVCGKSIMQYQIEAFSDAGIEEIIVIVGYKAEYIKSFFKKIQSYSNIRPGPIFGGQVSSSASPSSVGYGS